VPAYVALLRGINVGGNSLIRMAELRGVLLVVEGRLLPEASAR
jgi:uncharacterized protein (DUF1697 family)